MAEPIGPVSSRGIARPQSLTVDFSEEPGRIVFHRRRADGSWVFPLLWLGGWTVGCVALMLGVFIDPSLMLLAVTMAFWACWLLVAALFIWLKFGKETLFLDHDEARFIRTALFPLASRVIPRNDIQCFRECRSDYDQCQWGIELHAYGKSVRFAFWLPDWDRAWLVFRLNQFLKTSQMGEKPRALQLAKTLTCNPASNEAASSTGQPTILDVGGRRITVPRTPTGESSFFSSSIELAGQRLSRPRAGCLKLHPGPGLWVSTGIFFSIGCCMVVGGFAFFAAGLPVPGTVIVLGAIQIGFAFMLVSGYELLCAKRFEFNLEEGRLKGHGWDGKNCSLSDVLAVQVLNAQDKSCPPKFELNLVVDNQRKQLWNLGRFTDEEALWQQANAIADFLSVPLLDHSDWEEPAQIPSCDFQVSLTPMNIKISTFGIEITEKSPDCLVFRPASFARFCCGLFLAVGFVVALVCMALAVVQGAMTFGKFMVIAGALALTGIGWWLLQKMERWEFDRSTHMLIWKRLANQNEFPLAHIRAVQVLYAFNRRPGNDEGWGSMQLNLVLDLPNEQRWNLSNYTNLRATVANGKRLADFLGVPFLDHSAEGQAAAKR
jgi:hypothetical protein